jgi:hypothetical protein
MVNCAKWDVKIIFALATGTPLWSDLDKAVRAIEEVRVSANWTIVGHGKPGFCDVSVGRYMRPYLFDAAELLTRSGVNIHAAGDACGVGVCFKGSVALWTCHLKVLLSSVVAHLV